MGLSVGYVFKNVLQSCDDFVRRMKTHSVHFVIQSCKYFDILWVSVLSQTILAFRRHLGLIDTLGLDLMRLPRLSSVWMLREVQPFDQTTQTTLIWTFEPFSYHTMLVGLVIERISLRREKSIHPKLHQTLFANPAMIILGVKFMQGLYDLTGVFLLITEISSCTHRSHTTLLKKYSGIS